MTSPRASLSRLLLPEGGLGSGLKLEVGLLVAAALVGVGGALAAVGFQYVTRWLQLAFLGEGDLFEAVAALPWWGKLLVPTVGAGMASVVLWILHRRGRQVGLPDLMEAVSLRKGALDTKAVGIRALASLMVIGSGGSVGREGPIIQIASSIAAALASVLKLTRERWSLLVGCGVAAGMAAAYNTPIGASVFALELVIGNFAMDVFAPVVVASVTATSVQRLLLGGGHIYSAAPFAVESYWELPFYLLLGLMCGAVAVVFRRMLALGDWSFGKIPIPGPLKLPLGGLLIGVIGLAYPNVWGNGYETVNLILHQELGLGLIAILLLMKMVATSVTVGSGGIGGVFTPTLFVGAALGAVLGGAVHSMLPGMTAPFGAYALVGMGGLIAGTTHAPIMAILMLFELTGGYDIILPLMLCCIVSSVVARRIHSESIYTERLKRLGVDPGWGIEELALRYLQVRDVMRTDVPVLKEGAPFTRVLDMFHASRSDEIYVVRDDGTFRGVINLHDVKAFLNDRDMGSLVVAAELAESCPIAARNDPLATVMTRLVEANLEEIPVVEGPEQQFLGVVSRRDVIIAIDREVLRKRVMLARFHPRRERAGEDSGQDPALREVTDFVELPEGYILDKFPVPRRFRGRTLGEINLRANYNLNVISLLTESPDGHETRSFPDPARRLGKGDYLIVVGRREDIMRFYEPESSVTEPPGFVDPPTDQ